MESDDREGIASDTLAKHELAPGQIFAGRYEILSQLGTGGMSIVYKAKHVMMKNVVAVKMLLPHMMLSMTNIKRFQQEAQAASALSHPNVIAVHDMGVTEDGLPYLIMEYIEGEGLSDILKREGKLEPSRCLPMFIDACDALAAAHEKGIVHRDLKPSNLMVITTNDGKEQVKILDFGIAKLMPTEGEEAQRLTQTGDIFGSPLYMSPEQCLARLLDGRADIYSLGCVLYETVTGRPPLLGNSVLETMYMHMHDVPPGIGDAVPDAALREQLEAVFFKAVAKEPAQRYQTMLEFKAALQNVLSGANAGLLARLQSLWETSRLRRVPKQARPVLVIALVVALLAFGFLAAWTINTLFISGTNMQVTTEWERVIEPAPKMTMDAVKVEKMAELMLNLNAKKAGDLSPSLIPRLTQLGRFRVKYHKWQGASTCFEYVLEIDRRIKDTKSLDYYQTQEDLADCYYELGRYADAAPLYRNALVGQDVMLGVQDLAPPAGRLGECYKRTNMLPFAEENLVWSRSLWSRPRAEGGNFKKSPDYALTVSNLGDVYRMEGKLDSAAKMYAEAVELWKDIEGDAPRKNLALSYFYLGECQRELGQFNRATQSYKDGLDIAVSSFGPRHPYVANILYPYAEVLWKQNRWFESLEAKVKANAIRRKS